MASGDYVMQKWKNLFRFLDIDGDGILTFEELMSPPCDLIRRGKVEIGVELAKMFKEHWDRVLKITNIKPDILAIREEDWVKGHDVLAQGQWYQNEFIHTLAKSMFESVDLNGDGLIDKKEWQEMYRTYGQTDEAFVQTTFSKMDQNRDGFISREEMFHGYRTYTRCHIPGEDFAFLFTRL